MAGKTNFATSSAYQRAFLNSIYSYPAAGNVYYVSSVLGSSAGPGWAPEVAYATIEQAMDVCTANNGDVIVVLPGHTESIVAGAGLACDCAGVSVIGLGNGSDRPLITFTTLASATITVTAAGVTLQGLRFKTTVDELVSAIVVSAAYCTIRDCEWVDNTSTAQALCFLLTTANGDDLVIEKCKFVQTTAAASAQQWINLVGADRAIIRDNIFRLALKDSATSFVVGVTTTACLGIEIARNSVLMTGYSSGLLSAFLSVNTTKGIVADNRIGTDVAANTTINDMPGCYSMNNLCTNALDTSGIVDPVVDT